MIAHHFTVDVEEYFHASALASVAPPSSWEALESRVERTTWALIELLTQHGTRGTFFVLGWVAERHPQLVRALAAAGHEVASHGWDHRLITHSGRTEFRQSVRRSRAVLEQLTGSRVEGFRAPSVSIVRGGEWALDVLVEEGYRYDSSLFPVRRRGYGYAAGQTAPHWLARPPGALFEVPPTTLRRAGLTLPAAGGGYFRLLPYGLVRAGLREQERCGQPGTFYIHPWELDDAQPRLPVSRLTRVRHYAGLGCTLGRLETLLREFTFRPIADTLREARVAEVHATTEKLAAALAG